MNDKMRLIRALERYHSFNINDTIGQKKLMEFYAKNGKKLLQDFGSVIQSSNAIAHDRLYDATVTSDIVNIAKCDATKCEILKYHNRDRKKDKIQDFLVDQGNTTDSDDSYSYSHREDSEYDSDQSTDWGEYADVVVDQKRMDVDDVDIDDVVKFNCIRDLFASIHCYVLHQYDIGYRIHHKVKNKIYLKQEDNGSEDDESIVDREFMSLQNLVKSLDTSLCCTSRINTGNKYNITEYSDLLCDVLYQKVTEKCNQPKSKQMIQYFHSEEMDSDAILQIVPFQQNPPCELSTNLSEDTYEILKQYMAQCQLRSNSFSIGLPYYYWEETKDDEEAKDDAWNVNPHSGYTPDQLYVKAKYQNIKEEILHNNIYTMNIIQFKGSLNKAMDLIGTGHASTIWARGPDTHCYGIEEKAPLKISNLLSVIFYSDFDELSKRFSETFRKKTMYETLATAKERNREFAVWSRILRETVERFGKFGESSRGDYRRAGSGDLEGPFYCGTSFMVLPEFNIRLCGPTSTTVHIEVAMRFAGNCGVILQLNNNGDRQSNRVRGFDCSWISHYPEESECLFMGGHERIRIESVRTTGTAKNYEIFCKPLYLFDCMVGGSAFKFKDYIEWDDESIKTSWVSDETTDKDKEILYNLIKNVTDNGFTNTYSRYINDTFQALLNNKTQIVFNMEQIFYHFNKISDLILNPVFYDDTDDYRESDKSVNLFKDKVFQLFPNVKEIIVYTVDYELTERFPLDLILFLKLISNSLYIASNIKVTICANDKDDNCWLKEEFTSKVEGEFKAKQWDTSLIKRKNARCNDEYCLTISRL